MRIAISGSNGVGKSSLLQALMNREETKDFIFCAEYVRQINSLGIPVSETGTDETQILLASLQIRDLFLEKDFISDRCLVDSLVYGIYLLGKGFLQKETADYLKFLVERMISKYDLLFYIPIEFPLVDDGFRSMDENFRKDIDDIFKGIMNIYPNHFIPLTGSLDDRVKKVLSYLKNAKKTVY